ncbi:uncharacterized protein si:ch211-171b20.3 isoform X2 [Hoplias malabaricus]
MCGRHFQFDTRWRNGTYCENNFTDSVLKPVLPPVFRGYSVHQSHNLNRFSQRTQLPYNVTKTYAFEPCEGRDLLSVLFTVTSPPISVQRSGTATEHFRTRPMINPRVQNLTAAAFNNKSRSYPDPVPGAPSRFTQRILEISSLQEETVRQEKIKTLKKSKRQETTRT